MLKKYLDKLEFNEICNKLSLYCKTIFGKNMALNLEPINDKEKIDRYFNECSEAMLLIHKMGSFPISDIQDLLLIIKKLESSIFLNSRALLDIADLLKTSRKLINYYKDSECELNYLNSYFDNLYSNIDLEKKIFSIIISEDNIADNASSKLSSIRRNKRNLESQIKDKLNQILHSSSYSKYIMDHVITIRNNRYVIPVKDEYKSQIKGFIHDTSSSGSTVYIEPMSVFDINNTINNLLVEETREIERILEELSASLFPISSNLKQTYNLIGLLDFISSKAKFSIDNDYSKPEINNFIDLKNARHPLIDKDKVVPIDINLGKDFYTLVITGPNTGGKTVTLKTVGLLCLMAQSGLFIPAREGSTIKIFDNIFADIGDEQSIEESLSTFSSHITNIVQILNHFTDNSLILLDELGSGTDPLEGANLAISLLETFFSKKCFTIATTHYREIKNYAVTHDGFENASCEFDVKNLKPTYKLLIGLPGKSNAFEISKKLGIPDDIINRASSLIDKPDTDIKTLMKDIYNDRLEIEKEKIETQKNLSQIELLRKSLEIENDEKLVKEKQRVEDAKREAKEILLDAKKQASEAIKSLENVKDVKKANLIRNNLNNQINNIDVNGIDLSVLLKLNNQYETHAPDKKSGKVHVRNNKAQSVSTEINLIGETVAVAVEELDKYLDNCKMAGLHQVRVVHGKGTGKLREGIHSYLKKSKYVESFNIAGYGEGDFGVTIVNLKM